MDVVRQESKQGAYDFTYSVQLARSTRKLPYMIVSGFRWEGNEGGQYTYRVRLTEDGAAKVARLLDEVEAGRVLLFDVAGALPRQMRVGHPVVMASTKVKGGS